MPVAFKTFPISNSISKSPLFGQATPVARFMGNCQAADVAMVVIQHPDGRVDRAYWPLTASQVMDSNPGHYVAVVIASKSRTSSGKPPPRYLKLLPPGDTLLVGHVYLLVSFEDVLREFGSKKHVRLSRLLAKQEERASGGEARGRRGEVADENSNWEDSSTMVEEEQEGEDTNGAIISNNGMMKRSQWRPSLQSIAEAGNC